VTPNSTNTVWTVTLRPNTKFEDGTSVTSADIVDTTTSTTGDGVSGRRDLRRGQVGRGHLEHVGRLHLEPADANFPVLLTTFFTFNPDIMAKYGTDWAATRTAPGPFYLSPGPNNEWC